jgi:hypothetical protein
MKIYYLSMLALVSSTVANAQGWAVPDTSRTRPSAHLVKLGVRTFNQPDIVLSYERQLAPRVSLSGGLGYFRQRSKSYRPLYSSAASQIQLQEIEGLSNYYNADVQLRYYLRRRRPHRPLSGWYAAFAVHGNYLRTFNEYASTSLNAAYTTRSSSFNVQPQVYVGRQWSLGERVDMMRAAVENRGSAALTDCAGGPPVQGRSPSALPYTTSATHVAVDR